MNLSAFKQAFANSPHSPGIQKIRSILGSERAIVDFCVPVNIGFPPPEFMQELHEQLPDRLKYYPSEPAGLHEKFAAYLGVLPETVIAGNGSTELFYNILAASGKKRRLLTCVPTFGRWTDAPPASGHFVAGYARREENGFALDATELCAQARDQAIDTVVISNPNNPTGHLTERRELLQLIERLRREVSSLDLIVIDESFLDFSSRRAAATLLHDVAHMDRVVVLKSLGKTFGLHGTRMGVLVASPQLLAEFAGYVPYWNVNGVAESVIELMPKYQIPLRLSLAATIRATQSMRTELDRIDGAATFGTDANFVYMKIPERIDPIALRDHLLIQHSLFVRSCGNKAGASAHHFRIATRPQNEVRRLVDAIREFASC